MGLNGDSIIGIHRAGVNALVREVLLARNDPKLVVLEGFHALKHALRFDAAVQKVVVAEGSKVDELIRDHAPELAGSIEALRQDLPRADFKRLGPYEAHTGVLSLACKPECDAQAVLGAATAAPVVLLDDPRNRGNLGAVVRVGAAAEVAGVLSCGSQDPWHSVCVRGSAGLHFALPVAGIQQEQIAGLLAQSRRPLFAFDASGSAFAPDKVPKQAILAFGSERTGLSAELLAGADEVLALPMRPGVSSLNLATTVAAVLYCMRLCT